MAPDPVDRFRALALALPEVVEVETWGHPTFRVRNKMFATCGRDERDGPTFTCKAQPGEQAALVERDPRRFVVPKYVGVHGWVGGHLAGRAPWDEIAELVEEAWCMTAPKRVVRAHVAAQTPQERGPR